MSNHTPTKLATIGCGYFSQFHHQAWQRLPVNLVAVCDLDNDRARDFAAQFGIDQVFTEFTEMLDQAKPDLLDIILPPDQHLQHIEIAAQRGIDIICQKPFTSGIEQARQAIEIAERAGVNLIVHENFRFQPWYRKLKRIIELSELGKIYQLRFDLRPGDGQGPDAYLERQPYFQLMEQFLIKETGVHFIDVFRFLLGEPDSVFADLRQLNPAIKGEDAGIFLLDFRTGSRAIFDANRLVDHIAENRRLTMGTMLVEGSNGSIRLDGDGRLWHRQHHSNSEVQIEFEFEPDYFGGDCVFLLQQHILECRHEQRVPENLAKDYLKNLQIQQAIYQSSQTGTKIKLTTPGLL